MEKVYIMIKNTKMNEIDNHEDLPEYAVAKKVWEDIFNNDTLIYDKFDDYFFHEFYNTQIL